MWHKLSIRSQLILILALLLSFIEIVTLGFAYWSDIKERRSLAIEQANTLNRALNQDMLKALLNPQAVIYSDLSFRLSGFDSVSALALLNLKNDVVYQYNKPDKALTLDDITRIGPNVNFTQDTLMMRQALIADGYQYGAIVYSIDLSRYRTQLQQQLVTLVLFFPLLLLMGLSIAWWISRYFTMPVSQLASAIELSDVHKNRFQLVETNAENEIAVLYNGYNKMIQQIEISTRELREAIDKKEKADLANQAKSSFLANMSHELRTPLNAILGYSEIIKEDADTSQQSQIINDADKIHSSGTYLLELINNLLDLSKIEADKMELNYSVFPVAYIVSEVLTTVNPLLVKKANHIDISIQDNITDIETDMTRLRQILINLLSNANKFTENGRIKIEISTAELQGQAYCYFHVQDSGIGITAEQLTRLFVPFGQADERISGKYGGTGLGLVISKRFSQLLGGDITVESEPGKGSRFTVRLPMRASNSSSTTNRVNVK